MWNACKPILVGVASPVSEIWPFLIWHYQYYYHCTGQYWRVAVLWQITETVAPIEDTKRSQCTHHHQNLIPFSLSLSQSVIRTLWHPKLNQIFIGSSSGDVKVLYSDKYSHRGPKMSLTKRKRGRMETMTSLGMRVLTRKYNKNISVFCTSVTFANYMYTCNEDYFSAVLFLSYATLVQNMCTFYLFILSCRFLSLQLMPCPCSVMMIYRR